MLKRNKIVLFLSYAILLSCSGPSEFSDFDNPNELDNENDTHHPELITFEVFDIRALEAWSGGEIVGDLSNQIVAKGACWSLELNPTVDDNCSDEGSGLEAFESKLHDLKPDHTYYVRAYATIEDDVIYGEHQKFTTLDGIPLVKLNSLDDVGVNSALVNFTVSDDGGAEITARGVCWNNDGMPDINHLCTYQGKGLGDFESSLMNLTHNTEYYVRGFSKNEVTVSYSEELAIRTLFECGKELEDIDGNIYETVKIGDQCWMEENLNVSHYNDGTPIPNVQDNDNWFNLSSGAWAYYDHDNSIGESFGKLYNWYAATDEMGLCPEGWVVPMEDDWIELEQYLGMPQNTVHLNGWRGTNDNIGGKLKSTSSVYWRGSNIGAVNEVGFSALGAGGRGVEGEFTNLYLEASWWSSSENDADTAWRRLVNSEEVGVNRNAWRKQIGRSVRCILE